MQFFTVILSALALAVSTTTATPLDARATYNLNIIEPKEGDTWVSSATYLVKWDTSDMPPTPKFASNTGSIFLALFQDPGSPSPYLLYGEPPPPTRTVVHPC
jgi:hypothetical protein